MIAPPTGRPNQVSAAQTIAWAAFAFPGHRSSTEEGKASASALSEPNLTASTPEIGMSPPGNTLRSPISASRSSVCGEFPWTGDARLEPYQ